jgi:hypothetical protein
LLENILARKGILQQPQASEVSTEETMYDSQYGRQKGGIFCLSGEEEGFEIFRCLKPMEPVR